MSDINSRKVCGPSFASTLGPDFDYEGEEGDYRDVYELTGSALRFQQMEMAFRNAGYVIRKTELSPHTPPVAVLRLIRRTAPRFSDRAEFVRHVRQILGSVGISVPKRELTAQQNGNTTLVAFVW